MTGMFDERIVPNRLVSVLKPSFYEIMRRAKPHTMVSRKRMQNLWRLLCRVERDEIPGDFVELGVARGGTGILLATAAARSRLPREVWLYDAFEMFSPPDAFYQEVHKRLFENFGFDPARVHLFQNWFRDAAPTCPDRPISFMHIDAGGYEPVKDCLEPWFPRVVTGGWIALDNYGVDRECQRATDEFLAGHGLSERLRRFGRTQVYFQKP